MGEVPGVRATNPIPFSLRQIPGLFADPVEFMLCVWSQIVRFPRQLCVEPRQHRLQILPHAYPSVLAAFHHRRHRRHLVARRFAAAVQPVLPRTGNRAHSVFHFVVVGAPDPPVAQNDLPWSDLAGDSFPFTENGGLGPVPVISANNLEPTEAAAEIKRRPLRITDVDLVVKVEDGSEGERTGRVGPQGGAGVRSHVQKLIEPLANRGWVDRRNVPSLSLLSIASSPSTPRHGPRV